MGIKNLSNFLRDKCPDVYEDIHLSDYAYKKVAVDVSLFMCKFKAKAGDDWLNCFIDLVQCLRRNDIHCVFIYDNGSPEEKASEKEERVKQREKTRQKLSDLDNAIELYISTGKIEQILLEFSEKIEKQSESIKSYLPRKNTSKSTHGFDLDAVKAKIEKMKSNVFRVSQEDFDKTQELFDILQVPYYIAPLEAECMCADLCKRELVDGVLSEDTDVLAYGSPVLMTKIDTRNDTCKIIRVKNVLEQLNLTQSQFLDFCIMCGCDYNKNIPKVGCKKSFDLITKYKSIDEIERNTDIDITILNYKRSRQLFTEYTRHGITKIPFCEIPDFSKIEKFLNENNINMNIEKIKKNFIPELLFIIDDEETTTD